MTKFSLATRVVLGLAVAMSLALVPPAGSSAQTAPKVSKSAASQLRGGLFEASGVAHVPGTNGVLFVDDGTSDAVFWTELDGAGRQTGDAVRIPLGVTVVDPEGLTCDGKFFYVVGSQSKTQGGTGLARFTFDPASRTAGSVETVDGLEAILLDQVPGLAQAAGRDGVNVEGLAWDPERGRLLLGLRDPVVGRDALIVPMGLADPAGPFAASNLHIAPGAPLRLPLDGMGVRGMEYDPESRAFLIVAGASGKAKRVDFTLWEWNGEGERPTLRERARIDRDLKPEGIARVPGALFVACDVGSYLALAP